ncbi:AT-rich interactive domain-containing protein 2 isoform X3 [Cylas formicarius]|uniref:AT-rich interactive domain-containing protein 2 isoform X3 n=1 Tax=Cylas formicarius TaxID=197179 RepID=UPI00295884F6|nr:AT-rich interactive domain-containing protein 2 isoform X3 [Cylas formicarius]
MATILGKDEATYSRERDSFLKDLRQFHETRGTPFRRCPTLGSKEIDLYLLYSLVIAQGGWIKVNSKNNWGDLLPCFKLPRNCVNACVAIKQIYLRYLDRWEKLHHLGEEADRGSDDDEESRHKRWSARSLHSVPHTYNYGQHNVTDEKRETYHLAANLYRPSDYDRLALSLISPLPNEQDFAINVCTLLSNDGKHTLKLEKHPRIVDYLLAHAGIFNHSSLRQLFVYYYKDIRKKPIHNFWSDVLECEEFLDLTNETKFSKLGQEETKPCDTIIKDDYLQYADVANGAAAAATTSDKATPASQQPSVQSNGDCDMVDDDDADDDVSSVTKKFKTDSADDELFCVRRTLGTQDYVGQRVLQIATILRNLCFIDENVPFLTRNRHFVRFALLCATSRWNNLKNLGMDMLGNVAVDFEVRGDAAQQDALGTSLLKIVARNLHSDDRAACLSSIEVLNRLSQNERNEDVLLRVLESDVYRRVCSFLTIHDVMLLIYTLECLYSLSSLGERACNFISNNHGVIDTLVSLVTVEGKSYGPRACIGMKLVETVASGAAGHHHHHQQQQQQQTTQPSPAIASATSGTVSVACPSTMSALSPAPPGVTPVKVPPSTPARTVAIAPQRLLATPSTTSTATATVHATTTSTPIAPAALTTKCTPLVTTVTPSSAPAPTLPPPMTPQQMIQQQHAHQQAIHENEQFALAWLRATYEPCVSGKVDHQELYKQYINSCSKIGRRGVISPLHFPRCVRSVFGGTVGPNPMKPANPTDPQYYEGIKVRAQPLHINVPSSLSTTAQQCTPPVTPIKPAAARRKVAPVIKHVPPPPTPSSSVPATSVTAATVETAAAATAMAPPEQRDAAAPLSPTSPILKAQLSAPPKQREGGGLNQAPKGDQKSQALTHPHLSQALLGATTPSTGATSVTTLTSAAVPASVMPSGKQQPDATIKQELGAVPGGTSSTSLIKSLLATKVNDACVSAGMKTAATDCQNVAQVAARQQRLLAQQGGGQPDKQPQVKTETAKMQRLNGVRQLFPDHEIGDPSVSSTTQFVSTIKGKKEPPQPPPPPLAPLTNSVKTTSTAPYVSEDSDNSLSAAPPLGTVGLGGVSSTEDNDNSLTGFDCLLNGIPNAAAVATPDVDDLETNPKELSTATTEICIDKPLRLADLLEKKFEKAPILNGTFGKDQKLVDGLDLVENHIEKALSGEQPAPAIVEPSSKPNLKRPATDQGLDPDVKKPHLASNNVNGSGRDSPDPDSAMSGSNGEDGPSTVSTAAAKLFADIAADILEDEDEEQLMQEAQTQPPPQASAQPVIDATAPASIQQIIVDNNQVLLSQSRQIIVSQSQMQGTNQNIVFTGGTQLKTQTGQTVIVQNAGVQQRPSVLIQQSNTGQLLLSQGLQGQVQLLTSSQTGQYVLQAGGSQGYVVAQPQTAVVHGQPQTVLVAQTPQQQGTAAKTIIILQQQTAGAAAASAATHHQKVVVTPQGQQVVVTQVPRPIAQSPTVSNSSGGASSPTKLIKSTASTMVSSAITTTTTTATTNGVKETKAPEEVRTRPRVARDLTTPFVCEWGECDIETKFKSANEVYMHACKHHCPEGNEEVLCEWDRCDNMRRKRFSLMTHLQDKHCNPEAMKQSLVRRKQVAQGLKVEPPPQTPGAHPVYAPDAALHAIKRHALEFVNPKELQDDNEGPVTKSIRLTASLILRNLVIYSSNCKRYLRSYESHLANIALSNVESSRTVAQILYDINEGTTHR